MKQVQKGEKKVTEDDGELKCKKESTIKDLQVKIKILKFMLSAEDDNHGRVLNC